MGCNHKRVGIVTNQPNGYDPDLPHAAESVCERAGCIEGAIRRVAGRTNMTAYFREDRKPSVDAAAQQALPL